MDKLDEKLFKMAKSEDIPVPFGFDGRISSKTAGLIGSAHSDRRPLYPLRFALAAVLAAALLTGTALAVSPSLRGLLWGGFEPYVQELEPDGENTCVYDGVEARIVSALSDGHANILHVELRDLTGDRVRRSWERYSQAGENEFKYAVSFGGLVDPQTTSEEEPIVIDSGHGRCAVPIGFDEETGVMTLRLIRASAAPQDMERTARVTIDSGVAGTQLLTEEHHADDHWEKSVTVDGQVVSYDSGTGSTWTETLPGWELSAPLTVLPVRSLELDRVPVDSVESGRSMPFSTAVEPLEDSRIYLTSAEVSQLGITLFREPDGLYDYRLASDELTVHFRDGTSLSLGEDEHLPGEYSTKYPGEAPEEWEFTSSDTWIFPEPVDPAGVVSVTLSGETISIG